MPDIYDLDKTQEWLNRTIQLDRTPPVRGGLNTEPHARKHTALAVLGAIAAMALGIALMSRTGIRAASAPARIVEIGGAARVQDNVSAAIPEPAAMRAPAPSRAKARASGAMAWPPLTLDGGVVPLPGHTAPPAPVWTDGVPRLR